MNDHSFDWTIVHFGSGDIQHSVCQTSATQFLLLLDPRLRLRFQEDSNKEQSAMKPLAELRNISFFISLAEGLHDLELVTGTQEKQ